MWEEGQTAARLKGGSLDPAEVLLLLPSYCAVIQETATLVHSDKDKDEMTFTFKVEQGDKYLQQEGLSW